MAWVVVCPALYFVSKKVTGTLLAANFWLPGKLIGRKSTVDLLRLPCTGSRLRREDGPVQALPGIQLERVVPDSIEVEGVKLSVESAGSALKSACVQLGIGKTGSRTVLFKRLVRHMQRRKAEDELSFQAAAQLPERDPRPEPTPAMPTPEEIAKHNLTHIPFQKWCPVCVSTRSRRDRHQQGGESHQSQGGWPVVSLDFFYFDVEGPELEFMCVGKVKDKESKQPVLVAVDRESGMTRAVPLPSKDEVSVQYGAKEVLSFLFYLGRTEVSIPADNEPSMLNLVDRVVNARMKFGLSTRKSPSQPYARETIGAAEQAIQSVRNVGASRLQQLRQIGVEVKNTSDVVGWAFIHASALRNQFAVQAGSTPFERMFHVQYRGKLACFGDTVYFSSSNNQVKKGTARFVKGVFLWKTLQNDLFVCGTALEVYLSTTIRRLPEKQQFDKIVLKEFRGTPRKYGIGTIGTKLVPGLREREPLPVEGYVGPVLDGISPGANDEALSDPTSSEPSSDHDAPPAVLDAPVGPSPTTLGGDGLVANQPGGDGRQTERGKRERGSERTATPAMKRPTLTSSASVVSPGTTTSPMPVDLNQGMRRRAKRPL